MPENQKECGLKQYTCYLDEYLRCKLELDIRLYQTTHSVSVNLTAEDLEDLKSELTLKWISGMNRYTSDEIKSPRNLTLTICKNFLADHLDRFVEQKRNEHKFKNEWEHKIMAEKSRKQHTLLLYIDDMPGCEIREVFNKHLNIKQNIVVWLVYCGHKQDEIASALQLSVDYVQRLYKQAEEILRKVLM